ncbi:MAG: UDP-N-acetylmuramoyl-L-alanyl-D-glutamate--2,6-diaminopimelate ligase [Phycicoccus sp.]|nr:UDP-N-acetylmuramoyl-L-alanyl-D-glutamate--2,6-diaminopimelate ligase [Phycicoccus sp.]
MAVPRPSPVGSVSLGDLALLIDGSDVVGSGSTSVSGVTLDSRGVLPGDLYAALPGATTHGARFAAQAAASGAVAILTDAAGVELLGPTDLPLLVVEQPRAWLGAVARRVYATGDLGLTLVGITGTNGKTTTAYLVNSALVALGHTTGLIGTVETRIGSERLSSARTTPEMTELHALLAVMAQQGVDTCVMEVSSHALAQHRVDEVIFDLALFTNLSQDHLDFHGDMESYFRTKATLFTAARARRGLVCVDDTWGRRLADISGIATRTLTTTDLDADWSVRRRGDDPASFRLTGPGEISLDLRSALPGDFNIVNTAMAAAALIELGVEPQRAGVAILGDPHVPGRMERVRLDDDSHALPLIVVDYAHTPEAIRAALAALRPQTTGQLVCVTGAGGDRDRDKRWAMGAAAAEFADVVVVTDDNPRSEDPAAIRATVLQGARDVHNERNAVVVLEVGDRRAAIAEAVAVAAGLQPDLVSTGTGAQAVVVVVGKGHERGQEIAGDILPFDDRVECERALVQVRDRVESGGGR